MEWLNTLVQGTLLGGLYAMFAVGLSLMFGIMRLVNIAHGDFIVLASYLALVVVEVLGLSPLASLALVVPVMFVVGYGLQRQLLNRTLGNDILPPLLVTFGLSVALQNGMLEVFSADSQRLSVGPLESASINLGVVTVGTLPLLTFASAVAAIFVLNRIFYTTALGRAFRAVSDDPTTASLMGLNPKSVFAIATGLAMVIVTLAALYIHKGSSESKEGDEKLEASLRRIETRLGTLPDDAPSEAGEGWRLPDSPLEVEDAVKQ